MVVDQKFFSVVHGDQVKKLVTGYDQIKVSAVELFDEFAVLILNKVDLCDGILL